MTSRERLKAAIADLRAKHQSRTKPMPTSSMTPTAVANALKGEKSFESVQFPVTGDSEIDAISGVRAVMNWIGIGPEAELRVFKYLAERALGDIEILQRSRDSAKQEFMHNYATKAAPAIGGMVSGLGTAGQAIGAMPYPAHSPSSMALDEAFFRGPDGIANMLGVSKEP